MDTILDISNLSLSFTSRLQKDESHFLFRNLTLGIPKGKISAILGGNGAGKTTLFNMISGIQKINDGQIIFEGKRLARLAPYRISKLGIGRLFQGSHVFEELSILDNMLLGQLQNPHEIPFFNLFFFKQSKKLEKELKEKAENMLSKLFGPDNIFWEIRNSAAGKLSFGQQRLLAIARLLMGNYSLYLLDEPTAGVHAKFIEQISDVINYINTKEKKTIVIIEHNVQFVKRNAEYCFFLDHGTLVAKGSVSEILNDEFVQQSYIGS